MAFILEVHTVLVTSTLGQGPNTFYVAVISFLGASPGFGNKQGTKCRGEAPISTESKCSSAPESLWFGRCTSLFPCLQSWDSSHVLCGITGLLE